MGLGMGGLQWWEAGGGKRGGTVPVRVSEGERDGNINLLKYTAGVLPGVGGGRGA